MNSLDLESNRNNIVSIYLNGNKDKDKPLHIEVIHKLM